MAAPTKKPAVPSSPKTMAKPSKSSPMKSTTKKTVPSAGHRQQKGK